MDDPLVALGSWPRLPAQILRARLESAGIAVLATTDATGVDARVRLSVPAAQAEFAEAVVNELGVDDEVPDTSPLAYVARLEEHLDAVAGLLEELRIAIEVDDARPGKEPG